MQKILHRNIVVAGGGIGGLVFGLSCAQFGLTPLVIEQQKEFKPTQGQGKKKKETKLKQMGILSSLNRPVPPKFPAHPETKG